MYLAIVFYDGGHFLTMIKVLMLSITKRKRAYLLSVATKNISTSRLHHASLPLLKVHWGYAELRRQKSWIAVTAMHYDRHKQMGLPTCLARDKACQSSQNDTGDDPSLTIKVSQDANNRSLSISVVCMVITMTTVVDRYDLL